MRGQIIKIISDTHYVKIEGKVLPCKCRGLFRKSKLIPLVGDYVMVDTSQNWITEVLPRKNALVRPSVSNIDQGFLITSVKDPDLSLFLLDKFLVVMEYYHVIPVIVLSKMDLISSKRQEEIRMLFRYYEHLGYRVLENTEVEKIKSLFQGKTSVFTGQTGAGKSSLLNALDASLQLETGEISYALGRGKHTTRHVELIDLFGGKVLDTPGFSAFDFSSFTKEEIRDSFPEFRKRECKYQDCMHIKEDHCNVKEQVERKEIMESRYLHYAKLLQEVKP